MHGRGGSDHFQRRITESSGVNSGSQTLSMSLKKCSVESGTHMRFRIVKHCTIAGSSHRILRCFEMSSVISTLFLVARM